MASDMTMPSGVTAVCPLVPFCLSTQSGESSRPSPWDVTGGGTNGGQLALLSLRCFRRSPGRTSLRSQSQFVLLAEVRQPSRPAINSTLWEKHRVSGASSDTRVPPPHVTSATLPPQCLVGGRPGGLSATTMAGDVGGRSCTDAESSSHPESLSQEFLLLTSEQKNIAVENEVRVNKDNLTDLYVQHAIPLPQRDLPKNRWGKMMEKKREHHEVKNDTKRSSAVDGLRKRPLIVFDGSSTSTSIKVKRTENGADDRLKPLAQIGSTSDAFWKSPNSSSRISPLVLFSNLPVNHKMEHNNNDTQQNHDLMNRKSPSGPVKSPPSSPVGTTPVKLKRAAPKEEAEATNHSKPPEVKRKIQHVTWP